MSNKIRCSCAGVKFSLVLVMIFAFAQAAFCSSGPEVQKSKAQSTPPKSANELAIAEKNKKIEALEKEISSLKKESASFKEKLAKAQKPVVNDLNPVVKKENEELVSKLGELKAEADKKEAFLYRELGATYLKLKMHDDALDAYLKSVALNPKDPLVNYQLGLLYRHEKGDKKKAVRYLKKYLALDPKAEDRVQVQYLIRLISQGTTFTEAEAAN